MMLFLKKHWPLMGISVIVIIIGFFLFGEKKEAGENPLFDGTNPDKGLKLKDIHYTQDDPDEKVKWTLDAVEVVYSKDGQFFSFKDFFLKLEPEGKPVIELQGKKGEYDRSSGEIDLQGDIKGTTDNGYRILTDHIRYNMPEGEVTSDKPVKITGPAFSISGNALFFDVEKELLRIISGVTTSVLERFSLS
jgi:LPS export ABC transporter protein LptC